MSPPSVSLTVADLAPRPDAEDVIREWGARWTLKPLPFASCGGVRDTYMFRMALDLAERLALVTGVRSQGVRATHGLAAVTWDMTRGPLYVYATRDAGLRVDGSWGTLVEIQGGGPWQG